DDFALKRMADRTADRLRSVENVSVVSVRGGRDREIGIQIDPARLQAFGVTLSQARAALAAGNLSQSLQPTVRSGRAQAIRLQASFSSADDVRRLIVAVHDGRPVYAGDVATITDGPPTEFEQFSRFSFGPADPRARQSGAQDMPAVTIAVAKKEAANAVIVADAVTQRIERMQSTMLPQDVHAIVTRDDGMKANAAVNTLIEHLAIALVTVGLILVYFLGWREALIVTITVPLIFSITLAADLLGGVT